jgi:hypothetical protein
LPPPCTTTSGCRRAACAITPAMRFMRAGSSSSSPPSFRTAGRDDDRAETPLAPGPCRSGTVQRSPIVSSRPIITLKF